MRFPPFADFSSRTNTIPVINTLPAFLLVAMIVSPTLMYADDFSDDVLPILTKRCVRCHGEKKQNGRVRLDNLSTDLLKNARAAETWHDVLNAINLGEMPPEDESQLTKVERSTVVNWLTRELDRVVQVRNSTGGQVVIRRLNRVEYQNTMRDLLGLDIDYVQNLPPDGLSADGFKNNGAALGMSGLQLDYYLQAARSALKQAIVTGPEPEVFTHTEVKSVKDKVNGNWTTRLGRSGVFAARVLKFPDEGEFVIRIKAHAELKDNAPFPRMQVVLGYRADTQTPSKEIGTIDVNSAESKTYEFRARIEEFPLQSRTQSKYPGQLIWIRNSYSDGKPIPKQKTIKVAQKGKKKKKAQKVWVEDLEFPKIIIESVEFTAPVFQQWPPKHHTDILATRKNDEPSKNSEREYARVNVERFMAKAFRRPVKDAEVDQTMRFYDVVRPSCDSIEIAMRETLAMVLISPDFLYLTEPSSKKRLLTDFELASRLSYFLWSTMPDPELIGLAENQRLRDPSVLAKQVTRLLEHKRSWTFVEQFTDQWLDLSGVDRVAVNPEFYPNFKNELKPDIRRETQHYFAEVLSQDLSALSLLRSDFTMLNQPLAEHYGIAGPRGTAFERVALTKTGRTGGVLSHASVLLANSTGEDSHVIKRGVWIRERLLDDPPAPPPPNVPNLDKNNADFASLSLRDQLLQHRENDACANCHKDIDPWGLAMEDFDGIGLFRESVKRRGPKKNKTVTQKINAQAKLPSGDSVNGLEELKSYLVTHKKREFAEALTVKLLTYALGRSLEFKDKELVDELTKGFIADGYKIKTLIQLIVKSESFRSK
jgi:hypothetical protein